MAANSNKAFSMALRMAACAVVLCSGMWVQAQTVSVSSEEITTYPFDDPNPIPKFNSIYPYYRFEGFTTKPEKRKWTVVTLENDNLRLKIIPEVGGKIWSVVDKKTGEEMFYGNSVVKFRDIALRGPWTSGGIEFNFGVIGHAPTCSTPVDFETEKKADGSVSCYIGVLELVTRTRWMVEINLPAGKTWFTTRTVWHNSSGASMPYYTWVNTGVSATDDLHFLYPATHWVGHDGGTGPWPNDSVHGRNLSVWQQMNFGVDKSYHMAGNHGPYFATYYADKDFGMAHFATRDDKLGRKFFTWALSEQGSIWKDLLSDNREQYVELQSGRLFNQPGGGSERTPYKQFLFEPYVTDEWTEYWFPFSGTGGVADVTPAGVVNVNSRGGNIEVHFCTTADVDGTLALADSAGHEIAAHRVKAAAGETVTEKFQADANGVYRLTLGGKLLWTNENRDLSRPQKTPDGFNWDTAYGNWLLANDRYCRAEYDDAMDFLNKSLALNPDYVPSLALMAEACNRQFNYEKALEYAQHAISVDQYDGAANYQAGIAARALGKHYDAMDCFEMAAITPQHRSAAYTQLAKLHFADGDMPMAVHYAVRACETNVKNITALEVLGRAYSRQGSSAEAGQTLNKIKEIDPLNHFADFERYCGGSLTKDEVLGKIKEEFPAQELMELASVYLSLGENDRALKVLELDGAPNAVVKVWKARLQGNAGALADVKTQDLDFAFPFRDEDLGMLKWATANSGKWEFRYLMALLQKARGNNREAAELIIGIDNDEEYAPLFALKASEVTDKQLRETYLKRACALDKNQWRYCQRLTTFYLGEGNDARKALATVKPYYKRNPDIMQIATLYIRALIANEDYAEADRILSATTILPFEGETAGHDMYRKVKLCRAAQAIGKKNWNEARQLIGEARLWPKSLGAGKPYDDCIDSRMEDWMEGAVGLLSGNADEADKAFARVAASQENGGVSDLLQAVALTRTGDKDKAKAKMEKWTKKQSNQDVADWGRSFAERMAADKVQLTSDDLARILK